MYPETINHKNNGHKRLLSYLLRFALAVFVVEALIMVFFRFYPVDYPYSVFLDSGLLIVILAPVVYRFIYISWMKDLTQRLDAQGRLEEANLKLEKYSSHLEKLVDEKVAELGDSETKYTAMLKETNQTLSALIQASPLPIMALDPEGKVTIWSHSAERVFGWTRHEVVGGASPIVPEGKEGEFKTLRQRVLSGESFTGVEIRRKRKDGALIDINLSAAPIRDTGGGVTGIVGVLEDISGRKNTERQIIEAKQDWEDTFNTITDMVTVHDKDFNIIKSNKAAEKMLGLPLLSADKVKCYKHYHGTDGPPAGCPSCKCLDTTLPTVSEVYEPHLGMDIEIRAIPRIDKNNNVVGLIHVVRDITEQKKAARALIEEKNRSEAIIAAIGTGISIQDTDFKILYQNQILKDIMGDRAGEYCYRAYERRDHVCEGCPVALAFKDGGIHTAERTGVTDNGEIYVENTASPLRDATGKIVAGIEVVRDVSGRRKAQQKIEKSERELKAKVEDLQNFYDMAVGRELKMSELRKEVDRLNAALAKCKPSP